MRNAMTICCLILAAAGSPTVADGGLTILKPAGGETFTAGDTMVIQWQLDDSTVVTDALVIEISPDNGRSYVRIVDRVMAASPEFIARQCAWVVADSVWHTGKDKWIHVVSDSCRLLVHGYSNLQISDRSAAPFRIVSSLGARFPFAGRAVGLERPSDARPRITGIAPSRSVEGRSRFFLLDGRAAITPTSIGGGIRPLAGPGMMLIEQNRTSSR